MAIWFLNISKLARAWCANPPEVHNQAGLDLKQYQENRFS